MDLLSLNTLKAGDRIRMTKDHKDVGIHAGEAGIVAAIARDPEAPEFPTVYVQLDSSDADLPAWDNELMLTFDGYLDLNDENRGIDSRIDPNSVVACMEKTDTPRSPVDEQGRPWMQGTAEAA
jgi:hypothetical protein